MDAASLFLMLLLPWMGYSLGDINVVVIRQNGGDLFKIEEKEKCATNSCAIFSSGTATTPSSEDLCTCRCNQHLPAFREDLRLCVDDIHECVLAPFVGGSVSQQIPFVFLPLKSQIIHPSKEISFAGIQTPVCAVSGAKFLTEAGWIELRNPVDTDVPFRLFRDEGRTFLQWAGETDLRTKMSGRLVLVYLMCRELASAEPPSPTEQTLFSPCVSFRVVGSPSKYLNNVSEVAFSTDSQSSAGHPDHLSLSEYVAIGICSVLLGLIYVASVLLYLHLRKRNRNKLLKPKNQALSNVEDGIGIVKNNPLLGLSAHFQPQDNAYNDSAASDTELAVEESHQNDERKIKGAQITSALIHAQYQRKHNNSPITYLECNYQDASSIEKLPEANVSIVETLEARDERSDSFKALTGTARRKLYFNPAYFELQLLMTPPPAALEFLAKIREVITIAKQKMETKRFVPSLMGIPEEECSYSVESLYGNSKATISRHSSIISLKRENSRRKTCTGCPGCEPQNLSELCGKLQEFTSLSKCQSCVNSTTESKQKSIRKWLEDVPTLREDFKSNEEKLSKRVRSPTRSLPPNGSTTPVRTLSPRPASDRAISPVSSSSKSLKQRRKITKPKAPPPPVPGKTEEHLYDSVPCNMSFPPPDMIHEAMAIENKSEEIRIPTLTKKIMKAVIHELSSHTSQSSPASTMTKLEYEADSLDRSVLNKGYKTPPEYSDLNSQPSPSLSAALPLDEEMTISNAITHGLEDDHDYELIVLKKRPFYKLPELLQANNDYSLVSEVYVNNGYNYGSAPSSPSDSNCSTFDRRNLKIRYEDCVEKPGKLLIEVKDCADHYIPVHDSDSFEPDTLDRKPVKTISKKKPDDIFIDSLERPNQILLRSSGSFKKDTVAAPNAPSSGSFNRVFGSLREIYEAKTKAGMIDEGRLLTLEDRHCKRQRRLTNLANIVPPDLIPPPPHEDSPIYEQPKPPRKVLIENGKVVMKPPLPPKNVIGRSAKNTVARAGTPGKQNWNKQEDSGYLSTDSSESKKRSESEESLDDGLSESGAESVETHSVFFGSFRKPNPFLTFNSGLERQRQLSSLSQ